MLLMSVLYDTGYLHDALTVLQGGTPTASRPVEQDHYAVLHLDTNATLQDVKKAYRQRSKESHPDHCAANADPEVCGELAQRAVNDAHEVLSDSSKRRAYDSERKMSFAEKLDAVAQLVTACARSEKSLLLGLSEFCSMTGIGSACGGWLVWLVVATPWNRQRAALPPALALHSWFLSVLDMLLTST